MISSRYVQPTDIKEKILLIQRRRVTPYTHCSKLNSTLQALKLIMAQVSSYADDKKSFDESESKAANVIMQQLDNFQQLLGQCTRESFLPLLISTNIKQVKEEIRQFRSAMEKNLLILDLKESSNFMHISDDELESQDSVDIKRIAAILRQTYKNNEDEIGSKIEERFKSLENLGVETTDEDVETLSIPELPESIKLLIKHDDVVMGEKIGHGQSGTVYKGYFVGKPNEEIAIKVLTKQTLTQTEVSAYRREVYSLTILAHPSLLKFCGYTENSPFLICTEYMANGSVYKKLHTTPEELTPTIRSLIAMNVARGLEYLHSKHILHRDMKSLNVLLDNNYNAKICDFGLVRSRNNVPMTGMIGTIHWMAPEVLMSAPFYDDKVDVYSFGMFLWELLTNQVPYKDLNPAQIIKKVIELGERPPIPSDCPPQLARLIQNCWAGDPKERPSMVQIVINLQDPDYHFAGTNETEFQLQAGLSSRHKYSTSVPFVRSIRQPMKNYSTDCFHSPTAIMSDIQTLTGAQRTSALGEMLTQLSDAQQLVVFIKQGLNRLFADIMNEHSQDSETILTFLMTVRNPDMYDILVLKALLNYSSESNKDMCSKALNVLLLASVIRFEFLKSAPSFVYQLLLFIKLPVAPQSISALLQLSNRLIRSIPAITHGLWDLLVWGRLNLPQIVSPMILPCINAILTFEEGRSEVTFNDLFALMQNFNENKLIWEEIMKYPELYPIFTKSLVKSVSNENVYKFIDEKLKQTTHENIEFCKNVELNLPFGIETAKIVDFYKIFFENDQTKHISNYPEYYQVLEYILTDAQQKNSKEDIILVLLLLKKTQMKEKPFLESRLPTLLVNLFVNGDEDLYLNLLTVFYIALSHFRVDSFNQQLKSFCRILFGKKVELRKPAFACVALSGEYSPSFDFSSLVPIAAFYVHSSSEIMANISSTVISKHVNDKGVDLNKTLEVFIEHFKEGTKYVKLAVAAFANACKTSDVDPQLLKKMSNIYFTIQQ